MLTCVRIGEVVVLPDGRYGVVDTISDDEIKLFICRDDGRFTTTTCHLSSLSLSRHAKNEREKNKMKIRNSLTVISNDLVNYSKQEND